MNASSLARNNIARFDRAASGYDSAASMQAKTAANLVDKAAQGLLEPPAAILDIGCGTGFVAEAASRRWPHAQITAIDGAPGMLKQAQRKIPGLRIVEGDIASRQFDPAFDLILSNMVLHWLPHPRAVLDQWRSWLKPKGHLFATALAEGSFQEWRDLCAGEGLADGIWNFPPADFADDLIVGQESLRVDYASVIDFLRRLKATGASMPRPDYKPFDAASMRGLLKEAPAPFPVTYQVIYIEAPKSGSI